jgi:hypothetical protein
MKLSVLLQQLFPGLQHRLRRDPGHTPVIPGAFFEVTGGTLRFPPQYNGFFKIQLGISRVRGSHDHHHRYIKSNGIVARAGIIGNQEPASLN